MNSVTGTTSAATSASKNESTTEAVGEILVTFECTGFTRSASVIDAALSKYRRKEFNRRLTSTEWPSMGRARLVEGYITDDDKSFEDGEYKIFVCIKVVMQCSEEEIGELSRYEDFLVAVAQACCPRPDRSFLDLEEWYIADVEPAISSTCTECAATADSSIGCPDGAEICEDCFDAGLH